MEQRYREVDPRVACGPVIAQIRNAKGVEEGWHIVGYAWYNCVLDVERKRIGEYPQKTWNDFLAANGVAEKPIPETAD